MSEHAGKDHESAMTMVASMVPGVWDKSRYSPMPLKTMSSSASAIPAIISFFCFMFGLLFPAERPEGAPASNHSIHIYAFSAPLVSAAGKIQRSAQIQR